MNKEEIEESNTFKMNIPILDDEDLRNIDNNFNDIVNEFAESIIHDKELAIAQYIINKQQQRIDQLENKVKEQEESKQAVIDYIETKIEKNNNYLKNKYMNVKIRIRIEAEQTILHEILDQMEGEKR